MSHPKEILNPEEVEFLLDVGNDANQEKAPAVVSQQVVTMRGDLKQVQLADVFQSLGTARTEGMLAVSNPVEQRQVFFRDGRVRILVPARATNRRLGQRLVAAGVLDADHLRQALVEQRKKQQPLGALLVEKGYATREQIDEILAQQINEELFVLFTWEHGEFEFYRGPCSDAATNRRLEESPEFEIDSLLLEVARRAAEWEGILASIGSLDEVPVQAEGVAAAAATLDETHRAVLVSVDGTSSYRELGEQTMLSLFECARAARDLFEQGCLRRATDEQLLAAARDHLDHGRGKHALMIARALCNRPGERPIAFVRDLAALLRACNEPTLACNVMLEAAQLQTDPQLALDLAREARSYNALDLGALSFLRTTMLAHLSPGSPEVLDVTLTLLDGLLTDGDADRVLDIVAEVEQLDGKPPAVLLREARALARKKDHAAAVAALLEAAKGFEQAGDRQQVIEAYELALRLDRDRKDIRKTLRQLRMTPRKRLVRLGIIAATAILLLAMGSVWITVRVHEHRVQEAGAEIRQLLAGADIKGARQSLARWATVLGDCCEMDDLSQQVRFAEAAEKLQQQRLLQRRAAEQLRLAGDAVLAGDLERAFAIYQALGADPELRAAVQESADARIDALVHDLDDASKHLAGAMPPPPDALVEQEQLEATLTFLQRHVDEHRLLAVRALLALRDAGHLPEMLSPTRRQQLVQAAERVVPLLERGLELKRVYADAVARHDTQRRLDPLFKAAIEYEQKLAFAEALAAYQQLLQAQAGSEDLHRHFGDKVKELEAIIAQLAAVDAATRAGDAAAARQHFEQLKHTAPKVPFGTMVKLPALVSTSLPGATVRWNGQAVGRTPCRTTYVPGAANTVEIELERFLPVRLTIPATSDGAIDVLLTLAADWRNELSATVDQPATFDQQGTAYAIDRGGAIFALDVAAHRQIWRRETGDTAGYLSPPLLQDGSVLVASLDGPVRALDTASGRMRWQHPDLPVEYAPAIAGGRLAVATSTGNLVLLEPSTGVELTRSRLAAPPAADVLASGGRLVLTLQNGTTSIHNVQDLSVLWRAEPGVLSQNLVVTAAGIATVDDNGRARLVDLATGKVRWEQQLAGTAVGRLAADGETVLVTLDDQLVALDLRNGSESWRADRPESGWLGAARYIGGMIAAATRDGWILLYTRQSTKPRYRIEGDRRTVAMSGDPAGHLLILAGRQLRSFAQLP